MSRREQRVINAFIACVQSGEFTVEYAIILIEDTQRYGWLSETAKNVFYDAVDQTENTEETEENV